MHMHLNVKIHQPLHQHLHQPPHLLFNPQTVVSEIVNMSQLIADNAREFVYKDDNGRDQYVVVHVVVCGGVHGGVLCVVV